MNQEYLLKAVFVIFAWIAPIILGIWMAKMKGRSPHWMWFGLYPFAGWIAFIVLCFDKFPLKEHRTISAFCTDEGAELKTSFDASEITTELRSRLEKALSKKNAAVRWVDEGTTELAIRIVAIDQGNQFLRYLLPFIAPAILEIEGELALGAGAPRQFHHTGKEQMGVLGGTARGMLKTAAGRMASRITKDILRGARAQEASLK